MSSAEAKKAASLSKLIDDLQKKIILSRPLVDNKVLIFNHIFTDIYGQSEEKLINELADLASFKFDEDINSLSYAYLSLVRANEFSSMSVTISPMFSLVQHRFQKKNSTNGSL